MVPGFKSDGEMCAAKNGCLVNLLSLVCEVFEKLVNKRLVVDLDKCGPFSDFQYGFRCSQSTADFLRVISD